MSDTEIKQELRINDRRTLALNGVISIAEFGDECLTLETVGGEVSVEGEDLKIDSLTKEDGSILVLGKISGVFYRDKGSKPGFFKRLFG